MFFFFPFTYFYLLLSSFFSFSSFLHNYLHKSPATSVFVVVVVVKTFGNLVNLFFVCTSHSATHTHTRTHKLAAFVVILLIVTAAASCSSAFLLLLLLLLLLFVVSLHWKCPELRWMHESLSEFISLPGSKAIIYNVMLCNCMYLYTRTSLSLGLSMHSCVPLTGMYFWMFKVLFDNWSSFSMKTFRCQCCFHLWIEWPNFKSFRILRRGRLLFINLVTMNDLLSRLLEARNKFSQMKLLFHNQTQFKINIFSLAISHLIFLTLELLIQSKSFNNATLIPIWEEEVRRETAKYDDWRSNS